MVAAPAPRRSINQSYPLNPRVLLSIFRTISMHTIKRLFCFVSNKCNQGTCGQRTKKKNTHLPCEEKLCFCLCQLLLVSPPLPAGSVTKHNCPFACCEWNLEGKEKQHTVVRFRMGNLIHVEQGLHRILLNSLQPYNVRKQKYKCFPTAHLSCSPPRGKRHKAPKPKRN